MKKDNQYSAHEKRKYPRKKIITGVDYTILTTPKGSGITRDLSEGGVGVVLDKYLPQGTIIKVKFNLLENGKEIPIETVAKVVWCKEAEGGYLAGLQFLI
jgi:c-di-GMP-binding flagellar brake protein YcgR